MLPVATLRVLLVLQALAPPTGPAIPDVALERRLAAALGAGVGDTIRLGTAAGTFPWRVRVAAVYEPRADPAAVPRRESQLVVHLPDLERMLGAVDRVDRFAVALRPGLAADSAAAELNRVAFGFRAHPSVEIASESSQTFRVVSRFHRAIAVIAIVASAIFLLCIMLLKVDERRLDAAAMRLVGVGRRTVFSALLLEACFISAVGSAIGVGLGWLAGSLVNAYYRRFFETQMVFALITSDIVWFSLGLSLILGLAAGTVAAWRLLRVQPLALWRRE